MSAIKNHGRCPVHAADIAVFALQILGILLGLGYVGFLIYIVTTKP